MVRSRQDKYTETTHLKFVFTTREGFKREKVLGQKGKTNMAISESDLVKRIREAPINYALLKLIHHEFGNGLAVLSGYRHLLQQAISARAQENERELGYLRTMHDREIRLNNLLVQLRKLSPGATEEPLCQHFVRTDLVVLLGLVIEQRVLLCPNCVSQVSMPVQSLFVER